mgnify:CR=1 FL=1
MIKEINRIKAPLDIGYMVIYIIILCTKDARDITIISNSVSLASFVVSVHESWFLVWGAWLDMNSMISYDKIYIENSILVNFI